MRHLLRFLAIVIILSGSETLLAECLAAEGTIRVATYNTSLYRNDDGQLI
jgi:hypothetical protein